MRQQTGEEGLQYYETTKTGEEGLQYYELGWFGKTSSNFFPVFPWEIGKNWYKRVKLVQTGKNW